MRVIAVATGFYKGTRIRVGHEFEYDLPGGQALPKWVVAANDKARADIVNEERAKRKQDLDAMMAAAGPKRGGQPGVREVNTGLADATAAHEPGKVVVPSWYKPEPVETYVTGVEPVNAPVPPDSDLTALA
jgi:hypothetical protein